MRGFLHYFVVRLLVRLYTPIRIDWLSLLRTGAIWSVQTKLEGDQRQMSDTLQAVSRSVKSLTAQMSDQHASVQSLSAKQGLSGIDVTSDKFERAVAEAVARHQEAQSRNIQTQLDALSRSLHSLSAFSPTGGMRQSQNAEGEQNLEPRLQASLRTWLQIQLVRDTMQPSGWLYVKRELTLLFFCSVALV
jgi:hypothetical protein